MFCISSTGISTLNITNLLDALIALMTVTLQFKSETTILRLVSYLMLTTNQIPNTELMARVADPGNRKEGSRCT